MHDELAPQEQQGQKIVQVNVRGEDPGLWARLRPKLMAKLNQILDTTIDHEQGSTIREEARKLGASLLDYARQRLQREGLENDKIEAEVAKLYAERSKELAAADLADAQAARIRQDVAIKDLCLALALTKAMLAGEEGEEAILLGKKIDAFMACVKELGLVGGSST